MQLGAAVVTGLVKHVDTDVMGPKLLLQLSVASLPAVLLLYTGSTVSVSMHLIPSSYTWWSPLSEELQEASPIPSLPSPPSYVLLCCPA